MDISDNNSCIFCKIGAGKDQNTQIVYQNEDFVVFRDIRPASNHHYLVIPKIHIPNPKQLNQSHIPLVEKLISIGQQVLTEKKGDIDDTSYGFHWPPFNSISHLHLHVISPASSMSWFQRVIFRPNSFWFVTAEWLISRLKAMEMTPCRM
ncbi:Hypothetical predicted protein [Mytilus galloprovincialis]|uniref:Adenosine 5'-monophosphoramidase HINT3 n=1 Tax=Mytilus galloprovincialis TaxID=29158 RepID=A0A8B6F5A9_MYTGA|nr:Hypothetical predicted protein [Mytilus galloprovincialis]